MAQLFTQRATVFVMSSTWMLFFYVGGCVGVWGVWGGAGWSGGPSVFLLGPGHATEEPRENPEPADSQFNKEPREAHEVGASQLMCSSGFLGVATGVCGFRMFSGLLCGVSGNAPNSMKNDGPPPPHAPSPPTPPGHP